MTTTAPISRRPTRSTYKVGQTVCVESIFGFAKVRIKEIMSNGFFLSDRPTPSGQYLFNLTDIVEFAC